MNSPVPPLHTSIRITSLAHTIQDKLNHSASAIASVNGDLQLLSFNAKIQAAKAGQAGAGFGVVADEIKALVSKTRSITDDLQERVGHTIEELMALNEILESQVRGRRLAQVAANCIDLVDRNLYERSCDVRWWATEGALVSALENPEEEALVQATRRMATILEAYTVYFDLVLCDASGRILCNGRPDRYPCAGQRVGECGWFTQARRSSAGSGRFGSEGPLRRALSYDEPLIVFSCAVRRGGEPTGEILGVLGAIFNWKGLAQTVLQRAQAMLEGESENGVRAYLCDSEGTILADSEDRLAGQLLPIPDLKQLKAHPHRYVLQKQGRGQLLAAWAPSPGYETYRSGWSSAIVETRLG